MGKRSSRIVGNKRVVVATLAALGLAFVLAACTATPAADGSQNTGPTPSATVPAPNGGTIDDVVVDANDQPVDVDPDPTPIDQPADLESGVVVSIVEVTLVETKAETPGEIAGPGVAVRLSILNDTQSSLDVSTVMISLVGAGGAFGQPTTSSPASPFSGELAAGQSSEGVYVFGLPADDRRDLSIRVEYVAGAPVALFVGEI